MTTDVPIALSGALQLATEDVQVILIVTVGGSSQPIIYAIREHEPDYTVFICSEDQTSPKTRGSYEQVEGKGKVCSAGPGQPPTLPNIRVQADRGDMPYDIVKVNQVDDLADCYATISAVFEELRRHFPRATLIADYTGGTKTMSAALAMSAVDDGHSKISVVSGNRTNLVKVDEGTQFLRPTSSNFMQARRELNRAKQLMAVYDYPALEQLMRTLGKRKLAPEQEAQARVLTTLSRAFEKWDRFEHAEALTLLQGYRKELTGHVLFLTAVCSSRKACDPDFVTTQEAGKSCGFEVVEDLLLNAERRAHNHRYDDAVGRLYRALEMLVQVHYLKAYELNTSQLASDRLPAAAQAAVSPNHAGVRQTGLLQSYDLLEHFPDDRLWPVFKARRNRILNTLKIRNLSLFAHGFKPISVAEYRQAIEEFGGLIKECIATLAPGKRSAVAVQFPSDLLATFTDSSRG